MGCPGAAPLQRKQDGRGRARRRRTPGCNRTQGGEIQGLCSLAPSSTLGAASLSLSFPGPSAAPAVKSSIPLQSAQRNAAARHAQGAGDGAAGDAISPIPCRAFSARFLFSSPAASATRADAPGPACAPMPHAAPRLPRACWARGSTRGAAWAHMCFKEPHSVCSSLLSSTIPSASATCSSLFFEI